MSSVFLIAGLFIGGLLLGLLGWMWRAYSIRERRRCLAFAFAGEIAGILRLVETAGLEAQLQDVARKGQAGSAKRRARSFFIPRPVVFAANADALSLLGPSVSREIAQFYTLLGGIGGDVTKDAEGANTASVQLREALLLADDILCDLKPLLNRPRQSLPFLR